MKKNKLSFFSTILLLVSGILLWVAGHISGFSDWYVRQIYPILSSGYGTVSSLFPFSIAEWLLYLGILLLSTCLLSAFIHTIWKKEICIKKWKRFLSILLSLGSILFFLYTINCGINYQRTGFVSIKQVEAADRDEEDLYGLTAFLSEEVNQYSLSEVDLNLSNQELAELAVSSMKKLGKQYDGLSGYYPKAKPVCGSQILSIQQLTGIYSPFTVEANYNDDMPDFYKPFTICHELAHVKGYMKEEEANYIAILACLDSDSLVFQYSGIMLAYTYTSNALYQYEQESYFKIWNSINERAKVQFKQNQAFWENYDGAIAEASEKANDIYLKANAQEQGIRSYGMVVDLLLEQYNRQKDSDKFL